MDLGWLGRVVSTVPPGTLEGPRRSFVPSDIEAGWVVAGLGDTAVEALLPFGGSGLWLCWSGGAAIVRVDAVGGPPHGDVTDEGGVQPAALRRPDGLGAVPAGMMSDMVDEVGDQLGPLDQVVTPLGMVVDRLGDSG